MSHEAMATAEIFDPRGAAAYIGVSVPHLNKLVASGAIPSFVIGAHVRFRRCHLGAWKQEQAVAPRLQLVVDNRRVLEPLVTEDEAS